MLVAGANQEIVMVDVSVEEVSRMEELYSLEHLLGQHQHCFQGEFALAVVIEMLERRPQ